MTDDLFSRCQDAIDDLTRKTRRGRQGTTEEIARYHAVYNAWEAANDLPQRTVTNRAVRDTALLAVATELGLVQS